MSQEQPWNLRQHRQGSTYLTSVKHLTVAVALTAAMAALTSCGGGSSTGSTTPQPVGGTPQPAAPVQVTTSTALYPAFDPSISDYVYVFKPGSPLQVSVNAPPNTQVSVDGQPSRTSTFTAQVSLNPGQRFSFAVNAPGSLKTYSVRCLPADFPAWTTERPGTPQAEYYVLAPNIALNTNDRRNYIIISDGYGVPIWWYRSSASPIDAVLLPNNDIAWTSATTTEEHRLDGSLARAFKPAASIGGLINNHELLLLANGDYLFITEVLRGPVDLTPYGGSANATVVDNEIEEVTPGGALVWGWSAMDHLSVAETDPVWRPQFIATGPLADPYHMNSVEPDGDGYVISLRHLDAVIRINKASGHIVWKLSGSPRPESLTFRGDTYSNFGGQHDARVLADGTLTLHDNGSMLGRPPRAVRYRIDPAARTATLIEQVTDPDVSASVCCGSARKLPSGDWVASWGQNPVVTELTPAGTRVLRMTFQEPFFSYRAQPVPAGVLSRTALRSGMDAQFPR